MEELSTTQLIAYGLIGSGVLIALGALFVAPLRQRQASLWAAAMIDSLHPKKAGRPSMALMKMETKGEQGRAISDPFDEARFKADLAALQGSRTALEQYLLQLRQKFTKKNEIAIIQEWEKFYNVTADYLHAQTKAQRAWHEQGRLGLENEKDIAKLLADIAQEELRRVRAEGDQEKISQPPTQKSDYEKQKEQAEERDQTDRAYTVRKRASEKLRTLQELDRWRHDALQEINENRRLTPEQQTRQQMVVMDDYQRELRLLEKANRSKDEDPEIHQSY